MTPLVCFTNDKKQNFEMNNQNCYYLGIDGTYAHVEAALYSHHHILQERILSDTRASSHLMPLVSDMLSAHNLQPSDLDFIAVNRGPGALTSLRVSIATLNGIGFTKKIPLCGVVGFDALARDIVASLPHMHHPYHIATVLNAYNNDIYLSIYNFNGATLAHTTGPLVCKASEVAEYCAQTLKRESNHVLVYGGNGAPLCKDSFEQQSDKNIIYVNRETPSARSIARIGYEQWIQSPQACYRLEPLAFKQPHFVAKFPLHAPPHGSSGS